MAINSGPRATSLIFTKNTEIKNKTKSFYSRSTKARRERIFTEKIEKK